MKNTAPKTDEALLHRIIETLEDPVYVQNAENRWIFVNAAFCRLTGFSQEQLLGQSVYTAFPLEKTDGFHRQNLSALQKGAPSELEEEFLDVQGRLHPIRIKRIPFNTPDGRYYLIGIVRDMGSLKRTQAALTESGRYQRLLFENCPIGLALCRLDGQLIDINPAYASIIGRTVEETLRLTYWDVTPLKYAEQEKQQLELLNSRGRFGPYEKEYIHKKGFLVPVRLSGVIIERDGHKFIWSSIENISERKQAEAEVYKTQSFLHSILENIPFAVYVKDARTLQYVLLNKSCGTLLGYPVGQLLGKTAAEYFSKAASDLITSQDKAALSEQRMIEIPCFPLHTPGRGLRYFNLKKVPVCDKAGVVQYLVCISEDITEKKAAEDALKELRTAIEHTVEGIARLDEKGIFVSMNAAFAMMHGYAQEELLGKEWESLEHPQALKELALAYQQMLENGKAQVEIEAVKKDGSRFYEQLDLVRTTDHENKFSGCYCFVRDVTERKRRKEVEIKSELISMVSHEFRTPLHAVKESISIILEGLVGEVAPDQKDFLANAKRNVDRLARLVNNLLDFQKLSTGLIELRLQKVNLDEIIQEVTKDFETLAKNKALAVRVRIEEGLPSLMLDRDRITQVLWNLLSNAVRFSESGVISVRAERKDAAVEISVSDCGIGIHPSDLANLFQRFTRLENGKRLAPDGTGLGLAISESIIKQHGGRIGAQSTLGKGSTFFFSLPLPSAENGSAVPNGSS